MKFSNIAMLVIMLSPLVGCEEKTSGENSQESVTSKQSTELPSSDSDAFSRADKILSMKFGTSPKEKIDWCSLMRVLAYSGPT